MSQATRFSLTNCASTCLKHGKIRFFLPIYKMPTKLILLTETLMELAQGFHKQILIDQRDIERWDLKPSQHGPTRIVYYFLVLILFWSCFDLIWYDMAMCAGQRGDLLLHFFSPLPELLSEWQDDNMKGNMSTRFSLTNCASTCLKHDKIIFLTNL